MTDLIPITYGVMVALAVLVAVLAPGWLVMRVVQRRRARSGMPAGTKRAIAADQRRRRAVLP